MELVVVVAFVEVAVVVDEEVEEVDCTDRLESSLGDS